MMTAIAFDATRNAPVIPEVAEPEDLAGYFEVMTRAVFQAGVAWKQIASNWEAYRDAFAGFDPVKVAQFSEFDVERILETPGILRMQRKVRATIANANALVEIERQLGICERTYVRSKVTRPSRST